MSSRIQDTDVAQILNYRPKSSLYFKLDKPHLSSQSLWRFLVIELKKAMLEILLQPTFWYSQHFCAHKVNKILFNLPVPAWLCSTFIHSKDFSICVASWKLVEPACLVLLVSRKARWWDVLGHHLTRLLIGPSSLHSRNPDPFIKLD